MLSTGIVTPTFWSIFLSHEQSDSHNLKYMGIDALGRLIKINPDIAEEHQLAVIDCLEVRNRYLFAFF